MWRKQFSKCYANVTREQIWPQWANVNNWPKWDQDLEACRLEGKFIAGNHFIIKPKGGPEIKIHLTCVKPLQQFTDHCHFIGAKLTDDHILEDTPTGLKITNTISMTGPLACLWWLLVGRKVASNVATQTDNLVDYAKTH